MHPHLSGTQLDDLRPLLAAHRSYWLGWDDGTEADIDADLVIYRSGIAGALQNGVLRVRQMPIDDAVRTARERLSGLPWLWWVGADSDPGTAEALVAAGARLQLSMPVMAAEIDRIGPTGRPDRVSIEPVLDEPSLREYVACYLQAFGRPPESLDQCVEKERNHAAAGKQAGPQQLIRLVGRIDGRVIATCAVFRHDDVAAVYYVTTEAGHRRQGFATALTGEGLRIARSHGARLATLQARADAVSVYRQLGFETVSGFELYAV
jgi:ribosomal protein S18 acetylase RimI-like enzyme